MPKTAKAIKDLEQEVKKEKHAPLTVFDCLSETAPENANRCECQNDYAQLRAELARRFDLRDTPVAGQCSVISRLNCLRTCKIFEPVHRISNNVAF